MNFIKALIEKVGTPTRLARIIGVKPQSINAWSKKGYAPLEHIPKIIDELSVSEKECIDAYREFKKNKDKQPKT
ncbi:YdaS family helix-turn-helix protein [Wielerella bovis]|uniref:YdaS family helix-turn-helix protein n=1 Tax=Wielerella bovis TaxID=2917790 RepID=UPI0020194482|nr:YdaS family helix-turn-helix protein [Wielerella bovis]ULJ68158.1 helix-turn-helix domain-containing protein [Wielerella bovis]